MPHHVGVECARATKGFTLVELLIVIAIVAILAVVVILTLNPAQLLAQARDSTRLSDLGAIQKAILLYLADGKTFTGSVSNTLCYSSAASAPSANCGGRHAATRTTTNSTSNAINGTGWIPINFSGIGAGSPLSALPKDPTSDTAYFYSFAADTSASTFELDADLESAKYTSGTDNKEAADGGNLATIYEVGNAPGLSL